MIVEFEKSFSKSLDKIKDPTLLKKLRDTILRLEKAEAIGEIKNIKKLSGFKHYYRLRIGTYRLGFEKIDDNKIRIILIAHRKDIYKKFP